MLSTVGVEMGVNRPTRQSILAELPGTQVIDRSSMNAWEDPAFRAAVEKTGRRRLVFGALYTEICLAFPTVHAIADGHDVGFVADAVGGLSQLAHRTAIDRLVQAGAVPHTSLALVTELFRDWKSPLAGRGREIIKGTSPRRRSSPRAREDNDMQHILVINSSAAGEGSASRMLVEETVGRLRAANPGRSVIRRDLGASPVPHLTTATLAGVRGEPVTDGRARVTRIVGCTDRGVTRGGHDRDGRADV